MNIHKVESINHSLELKLKELAERPCSRDDCSIMDICGGNMDDAYYAGLDDGETLLARELLKEFG